MKKRILVLLIVVMIAAFYGWGQSAQASSSTQRNLSAEPDKIDPALQPGEMHQTEDGIVFLWRRAPGYTFCAGWVEVSILENAVLVDGSGEGKAETSVVDGGVRLVSVSVPREALE